MSYAILEVQKIHNIGQMNASYEHNSRSYTPENSSSELVERNYELVNINNTKYSDLFFERLQQSDIPPDKLRKNSIKALEFLFSYSDGADVDLEQWAKDNVKWLQDRYGKDNVISAVVHLDESVPHMHSVVIPITQEKQKTDELTEKERLCGSAVLGNKKKMREMRDDYQEQVASKHGLNRGIMMHKNPHRNIKRFYQMLAETESRELPEKKSEESIEDYCERASEFYKKTQRKIMDMDLVIEDLKIAESDIQSQYTELKQREMLSIQLEKDLENRKNDIKLWQNAMKGLQNIARENPEEAQRIYDELNQVLAEAAEIEKETADRRKWYEEHDIY